MGKQSKKIDQGIVLKSTSTSASVDGEIVHKDDEFKVQLDGAAETLTTNEGVATISNKTLDSTNTFSGTLTPAALTIDDNDLTIQDNSDTTKKFQFQASGITTGTTRTLTVPDANTTIVGTDTTQTLTNKTIGDSNTINAQDDAFAVQDASDATKQILFNAAGSTGTATTITSSQTGNRTVTLPDATDTLVGKATTDTLTNKTIGDSNTINAQDDAFAIQDASDATKQILFNAAGSTSTATTVASSQTDNRTITLPDATDTLVGKATTDTLTNKTIGDLNIINAQDDAFAVQDASDATKQILFNAAGSTGTATTIASSQTGNRTITLPDATDTLVGKATTDTLSNKTITSAANTLTIDADVSTVSNIKNAEIKAGAAIAVNKLAALTASRAVATDGSGFISATSVTSTELGYLSGATSNIQNQIDTLSVANGDYKASVRLATTANVTLSGEQTIDGTLTSSTRILVKDQSSASENGIYVTSSGAWTRATDFDVSGEVTSGVTVYVEEGSANLRTRWTLITTNPITLGVTNLTFTQTSGAGQITAGDGLTKTGDTLSVNVDNSTIEINSDTLRVKASGITSSHIANDTILNEDINSAAAIAHSKMAANTASRALVSDASGFTTASSVTSTEIGYVSGVTSAIQTQLDSKVTEFSGTDNAIVRSDGTSGAMQNSGVIIDDSDNVTGITSANIDGASGNTLVVDTSVLVVDASNNRVGINDASPAVSLDMGSSTDAIQLPVGTTGQQPSGADGMLRFNSSLNRFEGYKSASWGEIGGGGASESIIKLYRAFSDSTTDFTIKSKDDVMPDFAGSDTLDAVFSVPTSGTNALLSNNDANNVYSFATASNSQYDAQGFTCAIPKYIRGENVVLQFHYRTTETSGTPANGDWYVWVWDATNGVNTTTSSSGSITAGSTITVGTTTGMAVGDKIWIGLAGSGSVQESYITSIPSGTTLTISNTVTLTSGDRFVTGVLNDVITASLDASNDDTDKTGNVKKIYFKTISDTASVVVMWQQRTSQTDAFLYFDNILLSSDVLKSVPTRMRPGSYYISQAQSSLTDRGAGIEFNLGTATITQDQYFSKYVTVSDDAANTRTKWTANVDGEFDVVFNLEASTSTDRHARIYKNGNTFMNGVQLTTGSRYIGLSAKIPVVKGDYITIGSNDTIGSVATEALASFVFTPYENQSILVESVDSVVSGDTSTTLSITATTTAPTKGSVTTDVVRYRRVGNRYHGTWEYHQASGGTDGSGVYLIQLPSGLFFDTSLINYGSTNVSTTIASPNGNTLLGHAEIADGATGRIYSGNCYAYNSNSFYIAITSGITDAGAVDSIVMGTWGTGATLAFSGQRQVKIKIDAPIAGWSSYPKPVLAFPTISYGQNAEYYNVQSAGSVSSTLSLLASVSGSGRGLTFTAIRRCKVTASFLGVWGSGVGLNPSIYAKGALQAQGSVTAETNSANTVNYSSILEPGQTLVTQDDGGGGTYSRYAIHVLFEPEEGQTNTVALIENPVAWVKEVQTEGTNGGTSSNTTLHTRTLNTLEGSIAEVGVTLSANAFTLPTGKYTIEAYAPCLDFSQSQLQLFNNTDSVIVQDGQSTYSDTADLVQCNAHVSWTGTITKSTAFLIKHYFSVGRATDGLGITVAANNAANTATKDVYTIVKITRHK